MPDRNIVIDTITKIEGNAGLKVVIEDGAVRNLQFIIADYRRFFTTAVRGKRVVAVPSFLSRIWDVFGRPPLCLPHRDRERRGSRSQSRRRRYAGWRTTGS